MTTTAPPRSLALPPVSLSARPLRLDLPRFQLVHSSSPSTAPALVAPAPVSAIAPAAPVAPLPMARPAPVAQPTALAQPTSLEQPTSIAPVVATPSLTRRDGTIGLAIGILVLTVVLAAALAMQRSMHGWPPGMH